MSGRGLLLVDLQRDFLFDATAGASLEPPPQALIRSVAELLDRFRNAGLPVFHLVTRIEPNGRGRMPHWVARDIRQCVAGSPGAEPPPELAPLATEAVLVKPFYSGFSNPELMVRLRAAGVDCLIIAGVHTHACIRETAFDAYQAGFEVIIARDAIGSYDAPHARHALAHMTGRIAGCLSNTEIGDLVANPQAAEPIAHFDPCAANSLLFEARPADSATLQRSLADLSSRQMPWATTGAEERSRRLQDWYDALQAERDPLVSLLISDIAKPRREAEAEIDYALMLLKDACEGLRLSEQHDGFRLEYRAHGVVGIITPWNNPVAIAVGKIAPALAWGNAIAWKPAIPGQRIAERVMATLQSARLADLVTLAPGDAAVGRQLACRGEINALSFTGSIAAGRELATTCALRGIPFQGELGGNNAVIVMADTDIDRAAREIVDQSFSFSGQRCTAPRRIIAESSVKDRLQAALLEAIHSLPIDRPDTSPGDKSPILGPLISAASRDRIAGSIAASEALGSTVFAPTAIPTGLGEGNWLAPTLVVGAPPDSALFQEESFGPVLLLNAADDFDSAVGLLNRVEHGLIGAIFTDDQALQRRFFATAQVGMALINRARPGFAPGAPFVGWKWSGLGPPEHGASNRDFYSRTRVAYD